MSSITLLWLALAFFLIAAAYASVGFGGGSSYLAVLSLFVSDFLMIKTTGLLCNIVVVAGGSYLFYRKGLFDSKRFLPLVAFSVPAAFYAATIHLTQTFFFIALGAVLTLSGMLLFMQMLFKAEDVKAGKGNSWSLSILLGGGTGFLSGLVGIGGGILLSPILNLIRWDNAKKIAALASFFILVNSVAGLLGQIASSHFKVQLPVLAVLLVSVFAGGQAGTRFNIHLLKPHVVKGLTGILVIYIGAKLILKYTLSINI